MKHVHYILTGLSLVLVLLSANRLLPSTRGMLPPHDFLRVVDINAMLPIPLASVLLYFYLKKNVEENGKLLNKKFLTFASLLFVAGVYLFGAGSGLHEAMDYLNARFCDRGELKNELCNIVSYNDDTFSHVIYYLGFILLTVSLVATEYFSPRKHAVSSKDVKLVLANALFIALFIFANLAFEPTLMDMIVFGSMTVLTLSTLMFGKHSYKLLPVTFYFAVSYGVGVTSSLLYKIIMA
ncbi:MAG: hypothetical protein NUV98_04695 [Candidatus Roizmanbacteria bacterium]|nr:hypothetical protein [Candidatus Roizmanbacteria bacterium]